jgi:hypothetical protein
LDSGEAEEDKIFLSRQFKDCVAILEEGAAGLCSGVAIAGDSGLAA